METKKIAASCIYNSDREKIMCSDHMNECNYFFFGLKVPKSAAMVDEKCIIRHFSIQKDVVFIDLSPPVPYHHIIKEKNTIKDIQIIVSSLSKEDVLTETNKENDMSKNDQNEKMHEKFFNILAFLKIVFQRIFSKLPSDKRPPKTLNKEVKIIPNYLLMQLSDLKQPIDGSEKDHIIYEKIYDIASQELLNIITNEIYEHDNKILLDFWMTEDMKQLIDDVAYINDMSRIIRIKDYIYNGWNVNRINDITKLYLDLRINYENLWLINTYNHDGGVCKTDFYEKNNYFTFADNTKHIILREYCELKKSTFIWSFVVKDDNSVYIITIEKNKNDILNFDARKSEKKKDDKLYNNQTVLYHYSKTPSGNILLYRDGESIFRNYKTLNGSCAIYNDYDYVNYNDTMWTYIFNTMSLKANYTTKNISYNKKIMHNSSWLIYPYDDIYYKIYIKSKNNEMPMHIKNIGGYYEMYMYDETYPTSLFKLLNFLNLNVDDFWVFKYK
ncbi:MAG: hypothetical protein EOP34_02995 [Rickettsiales bacterium]|nr:MAG: hypothetical protein EOP34_02995 [Rickettsiales bacterium]